MTTPLTNNLGDQLLHAPLFGSKGGSGATALLPREAAEDLRMPKDTDGADNALSIEP